MSWLRISILIATFFGLNSIADADTRVALVFGNSKYVSGGVLPNPSNDAALIATALKSDNFDVTLVLDATRSVMLDALDTFNEKADRADWALIYYAGHGIEIGGVNYLLPIDVHLATDRKAQDEAITLDRVLGAVENAKTFRLVILDACRNNPFAANMKRSSAMRSTVQRGLGRPEVQESGVMVIYYAAAAGQVAEDGLEQHSPFTNALARRLQEPGLEVGRLFNVVTADVLDATANHQRPFLYGSNPIREELFFRPPVAKRDDTPKSSLEDRVWTALKTSNDIAALQSFMNNLTPSSAIRGQVAARIEDLRQASLRVDGGAVPSSGHMTPKDSEHMESADAIVLRCETLAAWPKDSQRSTAAPGVTYGKLDIDKAIPACRQAHMLRPADARITNMLARALYKSGVNYDETIYLYIVSLFGWEIPMPCWPSV